MALYTTTGSGQVTVPVNSIYMIAQAWSAGGGGSNDGGGGGGGGHALKVIAVIPGQVVDYVVGAGGTSDGGNSSVSFHNGDDVVVSQGGFAGNGAVGGLGGNGLTGDTLHRGGNGGILTDAGGGGGGGNGRSIINGNNGGSPTRGTPAGGTGGVFGVSSAENGNQPGGGGGGAHYPHGVAGTGGNGQVTIEFFTSVTNKVMVASSGRITSPPSATKFNLISTPVEKIITPATSSSVVTNDVSDNTYNSAVIDNEAIVSLDVNINHTFVNTTPAIATFNDSTGRLTRVSDGTSKVICKTVGLEKIAQIPVSRTASVTTTDQTFVDDSLGQNCSDVIDAAILGKIPSASTQDIFSSINDTTATYVRNTNLWIKSIDLTCVPAAAGNDINSLQGTVVGCAITRDIVLVANHAHYPYYVFVTADNQTIARSVISQGQVTGDIYIQRLSSDLPSSITPAKVLPANFTDYMTRLSAGIALDDVAGPIIYRSTGTGAVRKYCVAELKRYNPTGLSGENQLRQSGYGDREAWFTTIQIGNSGSPYFFIINNEPVLLGTFFTTTGGPNPAFFINQINASIASLGSNTSLNIADLSNFPTY